MVELNESLELLSRAIRNKNHPPLEYAYQFLRQAIFSNFLGPGSRIIERDIATLLQISRTPVREAIRRLESESLVEHFPNRGAVVLGLDFQDILELYELRMLLEGFVVKHIAAKTPEKELLQFKRKVEENSIEDLASQDSWDFHIELVKLTRNTWLQRVLIPLVQYIQNFRNISILHEGRSAQAQQDHVQIIELLLAGNSKKAVKVLDNHIQKGYQAFLSMAGKDSIKNLSILLQNKKSPSESSRERSCSKKPE
jgi:DNA-binding GntR family transcriptional regulator